MGQKFSDAARSELLSAITSAATTINLLSGGDKFPAANAGTSAVSDANDWFKLVLQDASGYEIVYVRSHPAGTDQFTNVLRGQDGTTAKAFAAGTVVGLRQTAADAADVLTRIAGREPAIAPGSADDYLAGNKTWGSFLTKTRAVTLAGLSTATNAAIAAADTVLQAFGKLQAQLNGHFNVGGGVHPNATTSESGFMSSADKTKLNDIAASAAALGTAVGAALGTAAAGTSTFGAHEDHVHPLPTAADVGATPAAHAGAGGTAHAVATGGAAGFMAAADKTKLDALPANAALTSTLAAKADLVGGKIPEGQLPAIAITDVFSVASQVAMLALTAQRGDIAVRTDINKSFALSAEPASTLANWIELRTPTDAVLSVAGKTGAVTLSKSDVGLSNVDNTADANKPVATTSVNGLMSAADKTKLNGVASGATANATDAQLRDRSTHTGSQAISTVTGLQTALDTIPANSKASAYTLALADAGTSIDTTSNVTIPANSSVAFAVGTTIMITNTSATNSTISINTDTLRQAGTTNTGSRTLAGYGIATLRKINSTTWFISGAGLS